MTFAAVGGAVVTAGWVAGVVKALVDGIKTVIPWLDQDQPMFGIAHLPARVLAVVLSGVLVAGYHVNLPSASGLASAWPLLDTVMTTVAVALASMGVNDVLNIWAGQGKTANQ